LTRTTRARFTIIEPFRQQAMAADSCRSAERHLLHSTCLYPHKKYRHLAGQMGRFASFEMRHHISLSSIRTPERARGVRTPRRPPRQNRRALQRPTVRSSAANNTCAPKPIEPTEKSTINRSEPHNLKKGPQAGPFRIPTIRRCILYNSSPPATGVILRCIEACTP
jgi:hypothetical protein